MRFDIEPLTKDRMQIGGHSVKRMIQNKSMPNLDLVVRESIQNSLDAALNYAKTVDVSFLHNSFNVKEFSKCFSGIEEKVNCVVHSQTAEFLAIRDCNTCGLLGAIDGEYDFDEKNQNLSHLVFEVMQEQEQEGAGGSWGIGKSVYYRIGMGLVIYYSRVRINGKYQERLIGALVEDERKLNGFLYSLNIKRGIGIAFFGRKRTDNENKIKAIIDNDEIHSFLNILGLKPFGGEETGTEIIIPFIDTKSLISDKTESNEDEQKSTQKWWNAEIEDYLENSILRWYFPRMCKNYPYGAKLKVDINGEELKTTNNTKLFALMQDLYNAAYSDDDIPSWINKEKVTRKSCLVGGVVGTFTFGKIKKSDFKRGLPSIYEYTFTHNDDENHHKPLIAFTRKPGMVINYSSDISNVRTDEDEYIIGVFTLNSNETMKIKNRTINLDQYIRGSEQADHMSWSDYQIDSDVTKVLIVKKIFDSVKASLNNTYDPKPEASGSASINRSLALKFGKMLMPQELFGNQVSGIIKKPKKEKTTSGNGGGNGGGRVLKSKKYKSCVTVGRCKHVDGNAVVLIEFSLTSSNISSSAKCLVNTLNGGVYPKDWKDNLGSYPFSIESAVLKCLYNDGQEIDSNNYFIDLDKENSINGYKINLFKTDEGKTYGIGFEKMAGAKDAVFQVNLKIQTKDRQMQMYFDTEVEDE